MSLLMWLRAKDVIYVRISKNSLCIRNIDSKREVVITPSSPFTTSRLLVGDFVVAEESLKAGLKQVQSSKWSIPSAMVMHPLEMTEGGLSGVEKRVFWELGLCAASRKCAVWNGHELSDHEVRQQLESAVNNF